MPPREAKDTSTTSRQTHWDRICSPDYSCPSSPRLLGFHREAAFGSSGPGQFSSNLTLPRPGSAQSGSRTPVVRRTTIMSSYIARPRPQAGFSPPNLHADFRQRVVYCTSQGTQDPTIQTCGSIARGTSTYSPGRFFAARNMAPIRICGWGFRIRSH